MACEGIRGELGGKLPTKTGPGSTLVAKHGMCICICIRAGGQIILEIQTTRYAFSGPTKTTQPYHPGRNMRRNNIHM